MSSAFAAGTTSIDWWDPNDTPDFQKVVTPLLDKLKKQSGIAVNNVNVAWGDLVPKLTQAGASHTTPPVSLGGAGFPQIFVAQDLLVSDAKLIKSIEATGGPYLTAPWCRCPLGLSLTAYLSSPQRTGTFTERISSEPPGSTHPTRPSQGRSMPIRGLSSRRFCKELNKPPNQYAFVWEVSGITAQPNIWSTLVTNGAYILDANGKLAWENDHTVGAFEYMAMLLKQYAPPGAASYDATAATNAFLAGKAAMFANGGEVLPLIISSKVPWANEVGFMPYPVQKVRSSYAGVNAYMIFNGSQVAAAQEFVKFMMEPANMVKSIWPYRAVVTPSLPAALKDPTLNNDPIFKRYKDLLETKAVVAGNASEMAAYFKVTPLSGQIEASGIGSQVLQAVLSGQSAEQAVTSATPKLEQIISNAH